MSLEGLRAWIGEVERKLGMRTRVFLVLIVIAIGVAGAAIYLAIDARESSVSESDVQALQEKLEAQIDELGAAATAAPQAGQNRSNLRPKPSRRTESTPETKPEPATKRRRRYGGRRHRRTPNGATGGDASAAKLQELVEQAKERSDEASSTLCRLRTIVRRSSPLCVTFGAIHLAPNASLAGNRQRKETPMPEGYCVKERKKVEIKDAKQVTMKNGRPAIQGTCPDCGTKIFKIGKLE